VRTLYLLRHGKSSWDDPSLDDFERPLNGRGRRAARSMAKHLAGAAVTPDLVLCSAAKRTRETLERLGKPLSESQVLVERGLYAATHQRLLDRLRRVPEDARSVMVIGHNPGLERLARLLCGEDGEPQALGRLQTKYPTGALATLGLKVAGWPELDAGTCRLQAFVKPADLAE
jgi:phosphohistidine phosphatase